MRPLPRLPLRPIALALASAINGCNQDALPGPADAALIPDQAVGDQALGADLHLRPDQCRTESDCGGFFEQCVLPGGHLSGCRMLCDPPTNPCQADSECNRLGPAYVCAHDPCLCDGGNDCVMGCTSNATCDNTWQVCGTDHRCVGRPCAGDGDCPIDFGCDNNKRCARKQCTVDDTCTGYCVLGACYSEPGTCESPPE